MRGAKTLSTICFFLAFGYFIYNLQNLELYYPLILLFLGLGALFLILSPTEAIEKQTEKISVYDQDYLERYGDNSQIENYNQKDHKYSIAISRAFKKVDEALKINPNLTIEEQLKLAQLEKTQVSCPICNNFLFVYYKFLVYCSNCEKFISELK